MFYDISDCSKIYATYIMYRSLIKNQFDKRNITNGQLIALEWANYISQRIGLKYASNWKIFKKNLAQYYFGKLECRRFTKENILEEIISYIKIFDKHIKVRMSVHKFESSCHSKSVRVTMNDFDLIKKEILQLQQNDEIEIFPEASNENSICFRRLSSEFGSPSYEVGFGQAMYVFESERGKHKVCSLSFVDKNIKIINSGDKYLDTYAINLINDYEEYFSLKANMIYRYTGIEYLSIEGYYNYYKKSQPIIVDFDLPFDYIFMLREVTK